MRARTRRVSLLAPALVLGAVLGAPASGLAGVPAIQDDHLTIAAPLEQIPERLAMVKATKAKVARFDVLWSEVATERPAKPTNPNDPAYDWTRADMVINGFAKAKIMPIVSVYSTPAWAVQGRNDPVATQYNPNAPRAKDYADFMQAVAQRYKGKARHFEVWNEPNLKGFFAHNGRSTVARYKALVKAAYPAIKKGNRRAIVIAGVAGPRSSSGNGNVGAKAWLMGLVGDKRVKFDAYSQHIYPSKGPRFGGAAYKKVYPTWQSLPFIYKQLDRKKKGMKLYVTEAGYTTAKTPFRTSASSLVSMNTQRTYLRQLFDLPTVKSPRMGAVVWFNLQDNEMWPAGLLRENGTKKPSYAAFRTLAGKRIPANLRTELNPRLK